MIPGLSDYFSAANKIRELKKRLREAEGLLDVRSEELAGIQTFLSTKDRLSEEEVLGIVKNLNQNIYQVAVRLTEEWEKLELPQATTHTEVEPTSQPHVPTLLRLVRNRNSDGLIFQLQSCLCSQVVSMTSSWGERPELAILDFIYERLSASEGQAVSARWRSLTHGYLPPSPAHPALLADELAGVLCETGSFTSREKSHAFVLDVALKGIESIVLFSLKLETAFMVEVTSSDMSVLSVAPGAVFDDAKMINEFESDDTPAPGRGDKVAGVTEVGVRKSVCRGGGRGWQVEILLKARVVLEKDVTGGPSASKQVGPSEVESELDSVLSLPVSTASDEAPPSESVDPLHRNLTIAECAYPIM